jgi:hypothetical protein
MQSEGENPDHSYFCTWVQCKSSDAVKRLGGEHLAWCVLGFAVWRGVGYV